MCNLDTNIFFSGLKHARFMCSITVAFLVIKNTVQMIQRDFVPPMFFINTWGVVVSLANYSSEICLQ